MQISDLQKYTLQKWLSEREELINMAIIKCKVCGEDVSDKAKVCPHCGATLIEEPEEVKTPIICEECGAEIPEGLETCPKCGCPVPQKEAIVNDPSVPVTQNNSGAGKSISGKTKRIIAIALAAILLVVGFVVISQNTLTGDDKVAYEMVLDAANNFKNPSSVRLVSGTVGVDKDCLFAGISATNGWGARSTSYYFIMGGAILEEDNPTSMYKATDKLNIQKINKKLEKALGSY